MALYERIKGTSDDTVIKIAVWSLINDVWLLQENFALWEDLQARHSLSNDELVELQTFFTALMTKCNNDRELAFRTAWNLLLSIERGVIAQNQINAYLNI